MSDDFVIDPTRNFTPRQSPPSNSPASQAAREMRERAANSEKYKVAPPTTEAEAEALIQKTIWYALARLAGIISNPSASDSAVLSAAKELSAQLQRRAKAGEGATYTLMPTIKVDNKPLIFNVGNG